MSSIRISSKLISSTSRIGPSRHVVSKRQSSILFRRGFAVTPQTRSDLFSSIVEDQSIRSTPRALPKSPYNPSSVPSPLQPKPATFAKRADERPTRRYALHIYASRNNTIMQFNLGTDTIQGGRVSSGLLGYKKSKRNSFEAGYAVALEVIKRATAEIKQHIPPEDLFLIKQKAEEQGFTGVLDEEDEARLQARMDAEDKALVKVRGYGFDKEASVVMTGKGSPANIPRIRPSINFKYQGSDLSRKPLVKIELVFNGFGQGRDAFVQALQAKESVFVKRYITRLTDQTKLRVGGHRAQKARRL